MRIRALAVLVVLAALLSASPVVAREAPSGSSGWSLRHTPGFPESLSPEWLAELLKSLGGESLADLLDVLMGKTNTTLDDLVSRIEREDLRGLVERAQRDLESGSLTRRDVANYIGIIAKELEEKLRSGANITELEDYLLALKALEGIASEAGYRGLASTARDMYMSALAEYAERLRSSMQGLSPPELLKPLSEAQPLGLPGLQLPEMPPLLPFPHVGAPSIGLPGEPLSIADVVLLSLAVGAVAVVLAKWRSGIARLVREAYSRSLRAVRSIVGLKPSSGLPGLAGPIGLYWKAVDYVSKKTAISKAPSTTHREYLALVGERLSTGEARAFRELTQVYEAYRFAGSTDPGLVDRAERAYAELVGAT